MLAERVAVRPIGNRASILYDQLISQKLYARLQRWAMTV
jgi:hypothetical protein